MRSYGCGCLSLLAIVIFGAVLIRGPLFERVSPETLRSGHEQVALRELKTILSVESQYYAQFGSFPPSLASLGPPATGDPRPEAAAMISKSLASGLKGGYKFEAHATPDGFVVTAVPQSYGFSAQRSYYVDQTLVLHQSSGRRPAGPNSPGLN